MAREHLTVRPAATGWRLESGITQDLMFLSGAAAERTARKLAACIASAGVDAVVSISDRAGAVVGTINYYSPTAAADDETPWLRRGAPIAAE